MPKPGISRSARSRVDHENGNLPIKKWGNRPFWVCRGFFCRCYFSQNSQFLFCKRIETRIFLSHIRKVGPETRDCFWGARPETQEPSQRWDSKGGIRDLRPGTHLIGRTRDPRPEALKMGSGTRDLRP